MLMPATYAAQELMLILEEYWSRTPALHNVPIYTISGIAARALGIYQTYIEMMGEDIRQAFQAVRVGAPSPRSMCPTTMSCSRPCHG